jgi:hypothetical protein
MTNKKGNRNGKKRKQPQIPFGDDKQKARLIPTG